jgi:energy-coupling factor transporter ATP-binding protein EcfA2
MDKSSERGSGQYDPTMDYHWQQFELRRLKGSGEDFQQLFEDIMVRARPGFMRVRPDGNDGDRKCDGLFRQDGIFFQVYSPDELKRIQVRKKINEDLDGAIKHWSAELKTWTFVYNARKGVTPVVLETLQEKQLQYPFIKIDHLSNDGLWEIARGLTLQQRSEIFGAPPSEKRSQTEINWRETCQVLLEQWKGLTTNALTKPDGVQFQLDDVFVPLGVVERRQKPRHAHSEGSPEQGSELYEEKVTPISHYDFFDNVLQQGQSKYSQGRRIAIIGEPGAGKTTQLQKIGDWILQETDGVPIWIPLSAVGEKGLRGYLTQDWLQTAIPELEVTEHHRNDLAQLLKAGKVWLLLDGADEMTVADALQHIAAQMRGMWLQNARVVLTCRLNVWEAGKNALDNFDVYRNLDFEYPDEVHQFIDKWFQDEPNFQQALKAALEQPGKERIRDMAKNPLRLTLLCYSWQIRQGELPETKAGLYEWFVDAFYEWNKGKVPYKLTSAKRKELNQALGELAREAIDQNLHAFG